jgi:hypothetical protein
MLIERYTLALFYFAMNGNKWDKSLRFTNTFTPYMEKWLNEESVCEWQVSHTILGGDSFIVSSSILKHSLHFLCDRAIDWQGMECEDEIHVTTIRICKLLSLPREVAMTYVLHGTYHPFLSLV